MEDPSLINLTTQPGTYLCQHCQTCIRSCGVSYPHYLGSTGFMDNLSQLSDNTCRGEYTHSSYKTFFTAANRGCFVCKTLYGDIPGAIVSQLRRRAARSTSGQVSSFSMTYMKSPEFACRLKFAIRLPPKLWGEAKWLERNFILQGLSSSLNLSVRRLPAGKTDSNVGSFALSALKTCIKDHPLCRQNSVEQESSEKWYPTRLIDVGAIASDRSHVRLIETEHTAPQGPYVTLSHCWGNAAAIFKLEKANKASLLNELPPLAKTFEEAIKTTKELGARYIWIDCICIVQDDKSDWEKEAGLMADVYRNTMCNISATASSDSAEGLFYNREELFTGISLSYPEKNKQLLLIREELEVAGDIEFAAITKRGWVLQERLLSPRIVHFTNRQLAWECNELIASESFPDGLPPFWTYYYVPKRIKANHQEVFSTEELMEAWEDILERYTHAKLTFRSDLLPALSGIAKYLQDLSGATYLTGIWKTQDKCVVNLAWQCASNLFSRPSDYRAPSWSWASTDNPVTFKPFKSTSDSHGDGWFGSAETKAEVIDVQITLATSDPTGPASFGFLIIEGPLNQIVVQNGSTATMDGKSLGMTISFDEPGIGEGPLFILPLYSYYTIHDHEGLDRTVYVYLVLSLAKGHSGCYSRCGLGRFSDSEYGSAPRNWDTVINGMDALCDEYLGLERGHRISIV
ncbi:heterokaryon incompatibility domain-containing protein [Trichoderma chlorosporum]